MPESPRPLWHGRVLALLGIVFAAFSLRSGVSALSPLVGHIQAEIDLPASVVGLIGAAPAVSFAILGLLTPLIERRLGLAPTTAIALTAIAAGMLSRAVAPNAAGLLAGTLLLFAGGGMGNILLPPLVKRYFPDRIGMMMTLYTLMMASSSFIPPILAVPVAEATHWRFSLGVWTLLAVTALVPWLLMILRDRAELRVRAEGGPDLTGGGATVPAAARPKVLHRMLSMPLTWVIMAAYAISTITGYVAFAWLPVLVTERAGVDPATAGVLLALFGASSIPWALLVPMLVVRWQATRPLYFLAALGGAAGLTGYLLAPLPHLMPVWTILYGFVGGFFPLGLVLISIRARTAEGVVVLSGFAQGIGFAFAAVFPVMWGLLREATGGWTLPILILLGVLVFAFPVGWLAGRRTTIEDDWEARHGRPW